MILRDTSELTADAIGKDPIVSKIILKKILKVSPCHQVFAFEIMLIVMLLLNYSFAKKQSGKKDLIRLIGLKNFEIIFILLIKVVVVQVPIFII